MTTNPLSKHHLIPSFITQDRCNDIIQKANIYGKWTSNRHKNYPTTDIPVDNIPDLNVDEELEKIKDICKCKYSLETDSIIKPYDIFVVKYDANGQNKLDLHRDCSALSFVLLLSHPDDFNGGGTFYQSANETIKPEQGGLSIHCGKVRHAGATITNGTRYILIGFLDVESINIRQKHPNEDKISNKLSDKRHLDFLWRNKDTLPIELGIRIINLKNRPEKLRKCRETLSRLDVPKNWILSIRPVNANEGDGAASYSQWKTDQIPPNPSMRKYWQRDITSGEIGCYVSHHLSIIQYYAQSHQSNEKYLLLLEDDADMLSDFFYRVDQCIQELKDHSWDCIDFGGISMDGGKNVITSSVIQRNCTYQTHCILYNSSGIAKINGIDYTKNAIPYDEYLLALRNIHPRSELNVLYPLSRPLICYHSYEQLSFRRSEGFYDTENNNSQCKPIPIHSRVTDPYDMKNYYRFTNVSELDIDEILLLTVKANNAMWYFQISEIQYVGIKTYDNWEMAINDKTKIVIVLNPSSMTLFRGTNCDLDCSQPSIFFIPSYVLFKCKGAHIYHANGDSLI
jgi:GR25 family glycosyltransferase involved in LPS biosynthesis